MAAGYPTANKYGPWTKTKDRTSSQISANAAPNFLPERFDRSLTPLRQRVWLHLPLTKAGYSDFSIIVPKPSIRPSLIIRRIASSLYQKPFLLREFHPGYFQVYNISVFRYHDTVSGPLICKRMNHTGRFTERTSNCFRRDGHEVAAARVFPARLEMLKSRLNLAPSRAR